ncbi:hypothetical protein [Thermococcus prieurii]
MAGFNWRSLFYLLFGFLLAFRLPTGALAILIGLLFVRIETRYEVFFSLGGFVIGTLAGTFAWGSLGFLRPWSRAFGALLEGLWLSSDCLSSWHCSFRSLKEKVVVSRLKF